MRTGRPPVELSVRFWAKVDRTSEPVQKHMKTGCWLWVGDKNSAGYGWIRDESFRGSRKILAHKASYRMFVGPIPRGKCVLHECDVRSCIRPSHLSLGTRKKNSRDMMKRGRGKGQFREGYDERRKNLA